MLYLLQFLQSSWSHLLKKTLLISMSFYPDQQRIPKNHFAKKLICFYLVTGILFLAQNDFYC